MKNQKMYFYLTLEETPCKLLNLSAEFTATDQESFLQGMKVAADLFRFEIYKEEIDREISIRKRFLMDEWEKHKLSNEPQKDFINFCLEMGAVETPESYKNITKQDTIA